MSSELQALIQQLKDVQSGKLWMGANFDRMLRDLKPEEAFVRPMADLHSVAEIISHLSFWRQETIEKVRHGKGTQMDDSPGNWRGNAELKPLGWETLKQTYDQTLVELIALLESKDDSFLDEIYHDPDYRGDYPYRFVLQGMLQHDLYHLGQLGLIMKYLRKGRG